MEKPNCRLEQSTSAKYSKKGGGEEWLYNSGCMLASAIIC